MFSCLFYYKNDNENHFLGSQAIRINSASKRVLLKIPYIDSEKADKIIHSRPFVNKNDLVKSGIISKNELKLVSHKIVTRRSERQLKNQLEGD